MTNDTTTLNGALREVAETLAANLTTKGVQSQYSEGLTSLANKVLTIPSGIESNITLENANIVTYTGEFTVQATITSNDEPAEECEVLLCNLDDLNESYIETTNEDGEVTFELTTNVQTKNYMMVALGISVNLQVIYNKYIINSEVGTVADNNGDATIFATLYQWNVRIGNSTIQLLLNNEIIDTDTTNNNGEIEFNVNVDDTTYFKLRYYYSENNYVEKEFGVQGHLQQKAYNFKLDGTESITTLSNGTIQFIEEDNENIMTGTNGYINEISWTNDFLWILECDLKLEGFGCGLSLDMNGITQRDRFHIALINESGYCMLWCRNNGGTVFNIRLKDENNNDIFFNEWKHVVFKKTALNTLELKVDGYTAITVSNNYLLAIKNHCLGITYWTNNNHAYIKNATVTYYDAINPILKETYHPLLNGTEEVTKFNGRAKPPLIINNELDCIWDSFSGYLTEGWSNTEYWKLTFELIKHNNNSNCGFQITKKGITAGDSNRIVTVTNGITVVHGVNGKEFEDGYYTVCAYTNQITEWMEVVVEKIGPQSLLITTKTSTCEKTARIPWPSMPTYEYLTIGLWDWGGDGLKIRNIHVKTSLEETT